MNHQKSEKMIVEDKEAFYFYEKVGNYTGHKANSLEEFAKKLATVDSNSLEFHLFREDFEKWVSFSLRIDSLAKSIAAVRAQKSTGEDLRNQLRKIIVEHIENRKKAHHRSEIVKSSRQIKKANEIRRPIVPA